MPVCASAQVLSASCVLLSNGHTVMAMLPKLCKNLTLKTSCISDFVVLLYTFCSSRDWGPRSPHNHCAGHSEGGSITQVLTSELFGLQHFASNHALMHLAPTIGGLLMSATLAGNVYSLRGRGAQ